MKSDPKIYSHKETLERLSDVFYNHGFSKLSGPLIDQLTKYFFALGESHKTLNMTRLHSIKDVGLKHFVDSLMLDQKLSLRFPIMDLGTGAGFPGVILNLLYPDEEVILVESVGKRVRFLQDLRDLLGLKNLRIIGQKLGPDFEAPTSSAVTRAIQMSIEDVLKYVAPSLPLGGEMIFMKGPHLDDFKLPLNFYMKKPKSYSLPNSPHKRQLVIFEKIEVEPEAQN